MKKYLTRMHDWCKKLPVKRDTPSSNAPIDYADMKVHKPVQAGAQAAEETDCANVQG
jgi:hypothetical protein